MIVTGDRVKLTATLDRLCFGSRLGTVVADDGDGYYVIDLDEPAWSHEQQCEAPSVVEHATSFVVLRDAQKRERTR